MSPGPDDVTVGIQFESTSVHWPEGVWTLVIDDLSCPTLLPSDIHYVDCSNDRGDSLSLDASNGQSIHWAHYYGIDQFSDFNVELHHDEEVVFSTTLVKRDCDGTEPDCQHYQVSIPVN